MVSYIMWIKINVQRTNIHKTTKKRKLTSRAGTECLKRRLSVMYTHI